MTSPLLPPLPSPPPGVIARLGDPRLLFPRGIEFVSLDPGRGLLMLAGDDLAVVRDLAAYVDDPGGTVTDEGRFVFAALSGGDMLLVDKSSIDRIDARTDEPRASVRRLKGIVAADLDEDERVLATLDEHGALVARDAGTLAVLRERRIPPPGREPALRLTRGGERALVVGKDVRAVDLGSGRTLWSRPRAPAVGVAPLGADRAVLVEQPHERRRDGRPIAPRLTVLSLETGEQLDTFDVPSPELAGRFPLAVSPDGSTLVVALPHAVEGWSLPRRARELSLDVPRARTLRYAAGALLVGAGSLLLFSEQGEPLSPPVPASEVGRLGAREGLVLIPDSEGALLWRPGSGQAERRPEVGFAAALSPDATRYAGRARSLDPESPERLFVCRTDDGARLLTIDRDDVQKLGWGGPYLVALGLDGLLRVFSADDGRELSAIPAPTATVLDLDVAPDGSLLALSLFGQPPRLLSLPGGERRPALAWPKGEGADQLALARAGRELWVGTKNGALLRFDTSTGALLSRAKTGAARVQSLCPVAGDRVAAVGCRSEGEVRFLRVADGQQLGEASVSEGCGVTALVPCGNGLVIAQSDGGLRLVELPAGAADAPEPPSEPLHVASKKKAPSTRLSRTPRRPLPRPVGEGLILFGRHEAVVVRGVELGSLPVTSGRLVVGDPSLLPELEPLGQKVKPGLHPVIALIEQRSYVEPLGLFLQSSAEAVVRWERAGSAATDSATLALADQASASVAFDDGPGGELLPSSILHRSLPGGTTLLGDATRGLALFSTGADGGYPVDVGLDRRGEIAAVLVQRPFSFEGLRRARLPGGAPPWADLGALVAWAHEPAAAAGDPAYELAPLPSARLAELEAIAGVPAPDDARRFYQHATPLGLDRWSAKGEALRAQGLAGFPLGDASLEVFDALVVRDGRTQVATLDTEGGQFGSYFDVTLWLVQTAAERIRTSIRAAP